MQKTRKFCIAVMESALNAATGLATCFHRRLDEPAAALHQLMRGDFLRLRPVQRINPSNPCALNLALSVQKGSHYRFGISAFFHREKLGRPFAG